MLPRAEADPGAKDAAIKVLTVWRDAIEKEESEAVALAKDAPSEIRSIVRFEAASAWLALAKENRGTARPDEIKTLKAKDPDLETTYYAKLDELSMPIVRRAQEIALGGLGVAVLDGILVKNLPSFAPVLEPFRSLPGFEVRATRMLDLQIPESPLTNTKLASLPVTDPAATIAATFPPWAAYAALERAAPAELLKPSVLMAMAAHRGIPSALRREIERDKKLGDPSRSAIALARTRIALAYGSRPDADAVAAWKDPKAPVDQLRVAIGKALVGPITPPPKLGDPLATKLPSGFELKHLDALAKQPGSIGPAAVYDAALLALEQAQTFTPDASDPPDARKNAYEAAITRLDAAAATKGMDAEHAANAKVLADSARESVKLLGKPPKKP